MQGDDAFETTLVAARAGADWAWRELYEDLAPSLARYARACHVDDPEDLVGDVFLNAVRALERFEGDRRGFRAWMFALTRNAVIDERRKSVRRRTEPLPAEALAALGASADAEQEALRALAEGRVRAVLGRLTPDQRDVLLLRIFGDFTIEEVARIVGKRPGAVKALQVRGLQQLRQKIASGAVSF